MTRAILRLAVFAALAGAASSAPAQDIELQLRFDGAPLRSAVTPYFECDHLSGSTRCEIKADPATGDYIITRPEPGTYRLHVEIDANPDNPARFPGDYDTFYQFIVTADAPRRLDVDVQRLIHLTAPWDNGKSLDGMLTRPWSELPAFDTPRFALRKRVPITFQWDAVAPDAEYTYFVLPTRAAPYERGAEIARGTTRETGITLDLPVSADGYYFQFGLVAAKDGHPVGELFTRDAGVQSWTCRFIVRDRSLPPWTYGVAALALAALALGLRRLPRPVLEWAAAGAALLLIAAGAWQYVRVVHRREAEVLAREAARAQADERSRRSQASAAAFERAVPKPIWWDDVTPTQLAINSLSDLMAVWQSHQDGVAGNRRFFKLAYQAILDHPDDEHLVVTGLHLMTYTASPDDRRAVLGFGLDRYFDYKQRTDNCVNCRTGDTIGQMVRDLAESDVSSGDNDAAIRLIERLVKERNDVSDYNLAETLEVLARAHWQKHDRSRAFAALEEGLRRDPSGSRSAHLRQTLARYRRDDQPGPR